MRSGAALIVSAALAAGCCDGEAGTRPPRPGDPAPDFRLETLEHGRFYLNQQRGRVVVISFWSTTCGVCKQELLEFEEYRRERADRPLSFAAVLVDGENRDTARAIAEGLGLTLPVLLDVGGRVTGRYGVKEVPTTFVVDPNGAVCFVRVGYSEAVMRQLRSKVDALLEQAR